jgi:TRAP-type C4-dicarboxylate transport system permease small subunit
MTAPLRARLRAWADRLIRLAAIVGAVGLLAEVAVILADVVGRNFGRPLTGAQDISQMAMVLVVFGGMALCDRVGGHVAVDVLEPAFPAWLNRAGDVVSAFLGALIFAGIAWAVWESAALSRMLNLSTNIINLPKAYFQYAVVALSLVTALGLVLRGVESWLGVYAPLGPAEAPE